MELVSAHVLIPDTRTLYFDRDSVYPLQIFFYVKKEPAAYEKNQIPSLRLQRVLYESIRPFCRRTFILGENHTFLPMWVLVIGPVCGARAFDHFGSIVRRDLRRLLGGAVSVDIIPTEIMFPSMSILHGVSLKEFDKNPHLYFH